MFCLSPREPQGIIACCNPVPPLVRQQVNELHLLVQQARDMPLLKVRIDWGTVNEILCFTISYVLSVFHSDLRLCLVCPFGIT